MGTPRAIAGLLNEVRGCTACAAHLPQGVRPVLRASANSRILIIGQAPGRRVHESGVPWDDKSGDALRKWLGMEREQFYNAELVALMPMGFCYPGTGRSGDLPPRPECAPLWHARLLKAMPGIKLTLLIGQYAQAYYLGDGAKGTLTETVKAFKEYLPKHIVLPHPSPRNNIWLKKNPWFQRDVLPVLKKEVERLMP